MLRQRSRLSASYAEFHPAVMSNILDIVGASVVSSILVSR